MIVGYARVSTDEQQLDLQVDALEKAGCNYVFKDKASGLKTRRKGLEEALSTLRKGDVFIVWKLDRVGRSLKHLIEFVEDLSEDGVEFKSLTDNIDTTSFYGRFFFHVMGALAEMERELIAERTRAGLAAARKRGRTGGRPKRMTQSKKDSAVKLLADGTPPKDVAKNLGVSIATLYRHLPASERG